LKSKGIDIRKVTEKSTIGSLMDTVVHPATVIIVMNDFKKIKNSALLKQAEDELTDVIGIWRISNRAYYVFRRAYPARRFFPP